VIGIVAIARLTGSLQFLEWIALDHLLRSRSPEPTDTRIVILGIDELDIRQIGAYPIPDAAIADLITLLQRYQPAVIGLDVFRNPPVEPGSAKLIEVLKTSPNVIAVDRVILPQIPPPSDIPRSRVGFSDILLDADGRVRRSLLGTPNPSRLKDYRFSLAQRLAKAYLERFGFTIGNGIRDPAAMRFGTIEIPRLRPNSGGYAGLDAGGVQALINFRSGPRPFPSLSFQQLKTGKFDPNLLRDRIVLVGVTVPSDQQNLRSTAIASLNPSSGWIYGVEFQAHAVSQLIRAVLEGRPLLHTWSDAWEYLWIASWGLVGIYLGQCLRSPTQSLLTISMTMCGLVGSGYLLQLWGWWTPLVPSLLVLTANGLGYTAFNQYDRILKARIQERQQAIEQTFHIIHNGPLQTLATILRRIQDEDIAHEQLLQVLANLNHEIRDVGEHLKQEALTQEESLYLHSGLWLDLKPPLHELFYQVYSNTLERDFAGFKHLKVKIRSFEPIDQGCLSLAQKRGLCRFLEEALCNVGKHAQGATRLSATGTLHQGQYTLRISDNGTVAPSSRIGEGTKYSLRLKARLKGEFKREPLSPQGTQCALTWPLTKARSKL
jgi:CHASE2 domain-containing sensor protein